MKKIYTIGRDEGCDIVIPDNTDISSRLHATLRVESNDRIYLTDQSRNGTYINGMKMSSNVEIPVSRKDIISFAHIYDLDWSLIPRQKNNILKKPTILLVFILALAAITFTITSYLHKKEQPVPVTTKPIKPAQNTPVTKPDTIIVRDTVVVKNKEENKPKPEKQTEDTLKLQEAEEEIYNPIY